MFSSLFFRLREDKDPWETSVPWISCFTCIHYTSSKTLATGSSLGQSWEMQEGKNKLRKCTGVDCSSSFDRLFYLLVIVYFFRVPGSRFFVFWSEFIVVTIGRGRFLWSMALKVFILVEKPAEIFHGKGACCIQLMIKYPEKVIKYTST